jgi:hypothetical protein
MEACVSHDRHDFFERFAFVFEQGFDLQAMTFPLCIRYASGVGNYGHVAG